MKIATLIKKHRLSKKLTQMDLAKKLGYKSSQFVCMMEAGKSAAPAETLGALIKILGLPEDKVVAELVGKYAALIESKVEAGKYWAKQKGE